MKRLIWLLAILAALLCAAQAEEPGQLPNVPAASEARLGEAANAPGGTLVFTNPTDPAVWPMIPAEEDGFACLTSTNWGADDSVAAVYTGVTAKAGDALFFRYKTSTETGFDLMQVCVNGEVVKVFTGEGEWGQYAIAFPADGEYEVSFRYSKDTVAAEGSDAVYIRDVQLLTGDAARVALAANPLYPVGTERTLAIANADAREIVFDDPTFALTSIHGLARYFIVPEGEISLRVTLPAGADPDGEVLTVSGSEARTYSVAQAAGADAYHFALPLDKGTTYVTLLPARYCDAMDVRAVVCFTDAYWADEMLRVMQGSGYQVHSWRYLDQVDCTLTLIDQYGEFVEGVSVEISADGEVAGVYTSDADGMIPFKASGTAFAARIVSAPEGYAFDSGRTWLLDAFSMDVIVDLTRVE